MKNVKNMFNYLAIYIFIFKNYLNFNYHIIINIMYINDKSVLYLVDEIICFQARQR